jgi:acetyltransferase-like isoleucine patch superfamily enzyme
MAVLSPLNRFVGRTIRQLHAARVRHVTVRLRRALFGLAGVLERLPRLPMDALPIVLRELGATVGDRPFIKPGLRIVAPGGDLSGLTIGNNVHFGSNVLLDLTAPITIGDDVALGARVSLGSAQERPRTTEEPRPVVIHDGALIATSVVLLPGVVVGRNAVVSAQTLVDRAVSCRSIVAGSPSRVVGSVTVA